MKTSYLTCFLFTVSLLSGLGTRAYCQVNEPPKDLYTALTIPDSLKKHANSVVRYSETDINIKGPGKAVIIVSLTVSYEYGGVPFTDPGTASADLVYGGPSQLPIVSILSSLLGGFASDVQTLGPIPNTYPRAEVEGQTILLSNPGADFTGGNGALSLNLLYAVVTL